jgi:hypothetical protein
LAAQIVRHQAHQRALPIQPLRDRLQRTADLVPRKNLEYVAWTVRSCRIVGSGGAGCALGAVACSRSLSETAGPYPYKIVIIRAIPKT